MADVKGGAEQRARVGRLSRFAHVLGETVKSRPFALAALGCALWRLSLPPANVAVLAWLAPLPWLHLAARPSAPGDRTYAGLYLAGLLNGCVALYWLTLPHWATGFGGAALCLYLAVYLPLFVWLVRTAVGRGVPLPLAAPIAWTACEYARAHLITGFSMAELEHSQWTTGPLLQICDLAGQYTLSFLMLLVAGCIYQAATSRTAPLTATGWSLAAAAALGAAWGYGSARLADAESEPGPLVLLIQGVVDAKFDGDAERIERGFMSYVEAAATAARAHPNADLMAWPESMYPWGWVTFDGEEYMPGSTLVDHLDSGDRHYLEVAENRREHVAELVACVGMPLLLNVERRDLPSHRKYNCNYLFDAGGEPLSRYDKMHPVLLGEYIPLGEFAPWLYRYSPLGGGLTAGRRAESFEVAGVRFSSSICYEKVLPHVIRRQMTQLQAEDREPDVLISLSNDGWFYGSTELDLHLICGIFRAVECRKPLLIAANTGISASIDAHGRLQARAAKRETTFLAARPTLTSLEGWYLAVGDRPWQAAAAACVLLAAVEVRRKRCAHGTLASNAGRA